MLKNLFARVIRKQENSSTDESPVIKILHKIRDELANQISLAKNIDEKINIKTISQKSHELDRIIITSNLSDEDKLMLQKFSATLVKGDVTVKSLRYEKQDIARILSNLQDV
ncbi:hypothetical protein [Nitrosopumilus sp.]|uniref:hypothetical protein n=1 Tax=Nitrosopumilus sp. TaxID=2024843 RepID=UPI0026361023|nr:hypothetical protein [Nitrosopumilus sp.]